MCYTHQSQQMYLPVILPNHQRCYAKWKQSQNTVCTVCAHCIHNFARSVPTCMLNWHLLTFFLHLSLVRSSLRVLLLVGCDLPPPSLSQSWCVLVPGGHAVVGVPSTFRDVVRFNGGRNYGPVMLPHLLANFRLLADFRSVLPHVRESKIIDHQPVSRSRRDF